MRTLRLKLVWVLVLPFLWFASPTPNWMLLGASVGIAGLLLRAWAAGTIRKEQQLTTTGPYAFTRNPLYVGSFFLGVGLTVAGGGWIWLALFLAFYFGVYGRTIAGEESLLLDLFGDRYRAYAANVPRICPRLSRWRESTTDPGSGFGWAQYVRNREWEAALGVLVGFGILGLKIWLK